MGQSNLVRTRPGYTIWDGVRLPTMSTTSTAPLAGRQALITGAASGIGAATARRLAEDGARVVLVARRADRLKALADEIGDQAVAIPADLTDRHAVEALGDRVNLKTVDLLVNNAAVMLPNPLTEGRDEEWRQMLDLNVSAVLHTTRTLLPSLQAAASAGRAADVVNVSSTGADVPVSAFAVYGATKAALSYLSRALRVELAATGLRVTDVKPGGVATELFEHTTHTGIRDRLASAVRSGKLLDPATVADAIAYAVSRPVGTCLSQLTVMPSAQPQ